MYSSGLDIYLLHIYSDIYALLIHYSHKWLAWNPSDIDHPPNSTVHLRRSYGKATRPLNLHITSRIPGLDQKMRPAETV
jgi:hypothetical protein